MAQPAQVGIEEGAQVGDAVFQHGDPVDAHAEGKALPFIRIDARVLQNLGMHHPRAEDFEPVVALAHLERAALPRTADIDLGRGLGEGEVRGAEAQIDVVDLEIGLHEFFEAPFEVGHRDILVDGKALDLMEHRRMRLVVIGAIDTAGRDDPDRRAVLLHRADLHRRGVRAQNVRRAVIALGAVHIEGIHLGAGRMVAGDVQRVKVIPVAVDLRAFGHGKAHIGKDRGNFFGDLADWVDRARAAIAGRQGHIKPFAAQPLVERGIGQRGLLDGQRAVDLVLERIKRGASHLTLFGAHAAQLAHLEADLALLAEGVDPYILDRGLVGCGGNQAKVFAFQIVHVSGVLVYLDAVLSNRALPRKRSGAPVMQKAANPCEGPRLRLFHSGPELRERGLRLGDDGAKRFGLVHGEIGENLAVHLDASQREAVDETRIGHGFIDRANTGIDALDPQGAEVPLANLAVAGRILVGLVDGLLGNLEGA